jgi:hypothetical protein
VAALRAAGRAVARVGGSRAGAARSGTAPSRRAARRRDRELRHVVLRLRGCAGRLPRAQRRVVLLRAGIGLGHVRSRARVAQITGYSVRRVRRLERSGLRILRSLSRDGCGGTAAGAGAVTTAEPGGTTVAAGLVYATAPATGAGTDAGGQNGDGAAGAGGQEPGDGKPRGDVRGERDSSEDGTLTFTPPPAARDTNSGMADLLLVGALGALALGAAAVREMRRMPRRRR